MLQQYRLAVPLGPTYGGQAAQLSAQVIDAASNVLASIPTFVEIGAGSGAYEGVVTLDTALPARIFYTWTGTPPIPFFPPDQKFPTGLAPNQTYLYPATAALGPVYAGQPSAVSAQAIDASGGVLADITPFREVSPGLYLADPLFVSGWNGLVRYAWSGLPPIPLLGSDTLEPATAEGSGDSTLTPTDLVNVGATVDARLAAFPRFAYLRNEVPVSVWPKITGHTITPPLTPGEDRIVERDWPGLDPITIALATVTFGIRLAGQTTAPPGVPDRVITPTAGTPYQGQITDPGTVTDNGTITAHGRFFWSRAETGQIAPGTRLSYFIQATTASGYVIPLEDAGNWQVAQGGRLG